MTTKILIDTNFLLIPAQFKVDIFAEIDRICNFQYEIVILDKTLKELEDIQEKQKGSNREAANLALQLVKAKDINIMASDTDYVDKAILELVDDDYIVATQDRDLKAKLKEKGVKTITLRQKTHLIVE